MAAQTPGYVRFKIKTIILSQDIGSHEHSCPVFGNCWPRSEWSPSDWPGSGDSCQWSHTETWWESLLYAHGRSGTLQNSSLRTGCFGRNKRWLPWRQLCPKGLHFHHSVAWPTAIITSSRNSTRGSISSSCHSISSSCHSRRLSHGPNFSVCSAQASSLSLGVRNRSRICWKDLWETFSVCLRMNRLIFRRGLIRIPRLSLWILHWFACLRRTSCRTATAWHCH